MVGTRVRGMMRFRMVMLNDGGVGFRLFGELLKHFRRDLTLHQSDFAVPLDTPHVTSFRTSDEG